MNAVAELHLTADSSPLWEGAKLDFGTGSLYVVVQPPAGTFNVRSHNGSVCVYVAEYDPRNYVGRV